MYSAIAQLRVLISLIVGFGPRLALEPLLGANSDCEDVRHLTYYILTRRPRIDVVSDSPTPPGMILARTELISIEVTIWGDRL